mmetsp:Transcript_16449/g.44712  ORF Transcript_16449/g.44712 Transcript_16449/m.44712 type:complete len:313 (+) Transcript_16449:9324-10262(+)
MPCTCTWWSSMVSKSCSLSLIIMMSVFLCWMNWNSSVFHTESIFLSASSIFSSFCARFTISPTSSSNSSRCRLVRSCSMKSLDVSSNCLRVRSRSMFQCRGRIDGWLRSDTSGSVVRKPLILPSSLMKASVDLAALSSPRSCLKSALVPSSITSVLISAHLVWFHTPIWKSTMDTKCHSCRITLRSLCSVLATPVASSVMLSNSNTLAKCARLDSSASIERSCPLVSTTDAYEASTPVSDLVKARSANSRWNTLILMVNFSTSALIFSASRSCTGLITSAATGACFLTAPKLSSTSFISFSIFSVLTPCLCM